MCPLHKRAPSSSTGALGADGRAPVSRPPGALRPLSRVAFSATSDQVAWPSGAVAAAAAAAQKLARVQCSSRAVRPASMRAASGEIYSISRRTFFAALQWRRRRRRASNNNDNKASSEPSSGRHPAEARARSRPAEQLARWQLDNHARWRAGGHSALLILIAARIDLGRVTAVPSLKMQTRWTRAGRAGHARRPSERASSIKWLWPIFGQAY